MKYSIKRVSNFNITIIGERLGRDIVSNETYQPHSYELSSREWAWDNTTVIRLVRRTYDFI